MKLSVFVAVAFASVTACNAALAQTKEERCAAYAREAARSTPATTGAARGAARGAVGGAIVGGNAGRGAAVGAGVGAVRHGAQKSRSYQSYYDECMSR
jgi:hypothetical protein